MENNKQPLTAEEYIENYNKCMVEVNCHDLQIPKIDIPQMATFMKNFADEQTKPLKEEIERLRDVSTQHLLDYTESNVLLQEKVAELESSLSLARASVNSWEKDYSELQQQNKELAEALDESKTEHEFIKGLSNDGNIIVASEKGIKICSEALTNYKQTKP